MNRFIGCASMALTLFGVIAAPAAGPLGDLTGPWKLFADDHYVAEKAKVTRTYYGFEKHPDNPLLTANKPWEGSTVYLYGTVLPEESGTGYRMWYHAWAEGEYRMLYATSADGLHWEKPALGRWTTRTRRKTTFSFSTPKRTTVPR